MGGRGAGFLVALAAASGAGCGELYDKNWNALGHVKIEEPPRSPESRRVEQPADPGVRIVWLNAGILAGVGASGALHQVQRRHVLLPGRRRLPKQQRQEPDDQ